jgi:hypothetical protein
MKIPVICTECQKLSEAKPYKLINLQINDENLYPFVCPAGHQNVVIHQGEKFEILFESATRAISDGYFKEAVSSISSSIERLFEYSTKIILEKQGIAAANINICWKNVSSQSERQLGAYIFTYLFEFKMPPPILTSDLVQFRNKVIHKGYFPSYSEVINYGEGILKLMKQILISLQENCSETILKHTEITTIEITRKASLLPGNNIVLSTLGIINTMASKETLLDASLVKHIEGWNKMKSYMI